MFDRTRHHILFVARNMTELEAGSEHSVFWRGRLGNLVTCYHVDKSGGEWVMAGSEILAAELADPEAHEVNELGTLEARES